MSTPDLSRAFPKIAAVISFCSNDWRYLKRCIEGVRPFSSQIIVTVCDHFFDGIEENYALLERSFALFPECTFLLFTFDPAQTHRTASPLFPEHPDWRHEWHNTGRYLSYFYLDPAVDFIFFTDCDEITDGQRFCEWLSCEKRSICSAWRFSGSWHFREAKYEAIEQADLSLLVKKSVFHPESLWDEDERAGLLQKISGVKKQRVKGVDGAPLIHHYSGVRTREEFKKKCAAWGHHWERDWDSLIEKEFSAPFSGTDFVRRYCYRETSVFFDPLQVKIPRLKRREREQFFEELPRFPNVIVATKQCSFKKQLEYELL